jgi:serine/threonine protein kinase
MAYTLAHHLTVDGEKRSLMIAALRYADTFVKTVSASRLVKHITPMATDSLISMAGRAVGTPAYMAPEIALGAIDIDGRADIYSLGCVAYFLLTGQIVFARPSPMSTLLAHLNDQPEALTARSELPIPPALEALILECLSKDPAARPATAAALGRRLAEVIPGRSWSAEEAHAWWELHRVSATERPLDVPLGQDVTERSLRAKPGGRCWPKLDGTSRD